MKILILDIRKNLQEALKKRNLPKEMIDVIADEYLEGELQGKTSHGLMAFPSFLKKVNNYINKKYEIILKKNSLIVLEANELPGSYLGRVLADDLIEMAKSEGVAIGFIKNMATWLRPGAIAQYVADKKMVAFVINNGGESMVAPPGGYDPIIGTNPIGIGVPTANEPIVVDMATSKRAWGEVRKALKNKTDLPKESYYTAKGEFAVKPEDAYSAIPGGDYKGFALGLFIEMMTGSFLGRQMNTQKARNDYQSITRGGMILVMNPAIVNNLKDFEKANSKLIKEIKGSKKLSGVDRIYIPGEKATEKRQENLKNGYLEVDDDLWKQIIK
jgi:LDH2 family malate/lactate/ureidoglycolate dehydrogenase